MKNGVEIRFKMFAPISCVIFYIIPVLFQVTTCTADLPPTPPTLKITSPGELEYAAVLVKRVGDNLTLVCTQGDDSQRMFVWNYVPANSSTGNIPYTTSPGILSTGSRLTKDSLTIGDSGHYMCSAPPHSVTKLILVQPRGPKQCARGAYWCGSACVLAAYVCDGFKDCLHGEDEAPTLCDTNVCARPDKLNCSTGRCIPEAACCRVPGPMCKQPSCCDEHPLYNRLEGYVDSEYPPLYEDRRAPDEYGFIQSTIYTVTACALIFMIAVVLLVSAICKMHMKRAALNSYAAADRETRRHYNVHLAQTHRFPPCYETSRLLEQERTTASPTRTHNVTTPDSPARSPLVCSTSCPEDQPPQDTGFGLARLSALLGARYHYHQAPTNPPDVELRDVRATSLNASPVRERTRAPMGHYRSPTYCDLNQQLVFNTETGNCGRELNYMATPMELYRSRTLRSNFDRVMDQIQRPRPLTLQLGRFQLSIPRLGRRTSTERRPDTPNVAELNIDDLDFVRLNSNDTYTLNGRTIRLLGANFENYPLLNDNSDTRPPPYTEAVRYKLYGPPPEYLSRDALNNDNGNNVTVIPSPITATEEQARSNVEEPPCYEDLASGVDTNANNVAGINNGTNNGVIESSNNVTTRPINNDTQLSERDRSDTVITVSNNGITALNNVITGSNAVTSLATSYSDNATNNVTENLSSVIDNLPAIDSDVNANETEVRYSVTNNGNNDNGNNNVC